MLYIGGGLSLPHQLWVLTLRHLLNVLLPLSVIVALEHLRHVLGYVWIRYKSRKGQRPVDSYVKQALPQEADSKLWPRVAVQLPIFNERLVCQALIDCACSMDWPSHRICVQVCVGGKGVC